MTKKLKALLSICVSVVVFVSASITTFASIGPDIVEASAESSDEMTTMHESDFEEAFNTISQKTKLVADEKNLAEEKRRLEEEQHVTEIEKRRNNVIEFASEYLGNPYVYGGGSLEYGIDCSHFVWEVYKGAEGFDPGYHVACDWINIGESVASYSEAKKGDLIVWSEHIAIYMGDNQIIHASGSAGQITISDMPDPSTYTSGFMGIRRIISDNEDL